MPTRRDFLNASAAGLFAAKPGSSILANTRASISRAGATKIKSLRRREETIIRYDVNGDNWHMSWASNDRQYVGLCDGTGLAVTPTVSFNSRLLIIEGAAEAAKFLDLPSYPMLGRPTQRPTDPRYYNFGMLAVGRTIFQFMSTFNRSFRPDELDALDPNNRVRFVGAKLIYSPDDGRTWRNQDGTAPVAWEQWADRSRETMVFFDEDQEPFSLLTVLQMGRGYQDNRDGYVYVYAPNGNTDGTMNELVMFRVPKDNFVDRTRYEFFAGRTSSGGAKWTRVIADRAVVHTFPRGWVNTFVHPYAWHPSVVYNHPLGVYMMANWGMGVGPDGMWFGRPSYLGFWTAPKPWGPWTQIHEETAWLPSGDAKARAYQPQIAPKWIAPDGRSFWLVWTDFQERNKEEFTRFVKEEIEQKYWMNEMTEADLARMSAMSRQNRPYYKFNAQRVDLVV